MKKWIIGLVAVIVIIGLIILISNSGSEEKINRLSNIPASAVKVEIGNDNYPPLVNSNEYMTPMPVSRTINSAGAEDSPFIPAGSNELYFFFTPDVKVPVEKQLLDKVTGIYVSKNVDGAWTEPERVFMQKKNELALDGCEFIDKDVMLFCSAREGYTGINWFYSERKSGKWEFKKKVDFPESYEVGELHENNNELYYHSGRTGGKGGLDIWMIKRNSDGTWTEPVNVEAVNSPDNEGWPYISQDGNELWFNRQFMGSPAVYRSKKMNGVWEEPELIISQFAGEPTLDEKGNVYFVHHFYKNGEMIEADIYVSYKR